MTQEPCPEPEVDPAASLAVEQARAALALDAADLAEFEWDAARDIFIVSPRMARITGMPEGEHPSEGGEYALTFVHPDDRDDLRALITDQLTHDARYHAEYRFVRPDDHRVRWMESWGVVLRLPGGEPRRMIGVVRDVTERKAAEGARETLVAELDHRVKNVLASVQALAAQSARRTPSLETFLKTFTGRLQAMGAAHTLLSRTRWRGAEIGDVVTAELGPLANGRARWSGPAMVLTPRATNALAIALHELSTNAMKYGALSVGAGRVDVRWAATPEGGFELVWTERRGPQVAAPTRQGFGTMLLEKVTGRELGGAVDVEFRPEGLHATLRADNGAVAPPDAPTAEIVSAEASGHHEQSSSEQKAEIAGLMVLIVEDASLLALELESALHEAGAEVLGLAGSVEEAIGMLDRPFDVVLLDADLNGASAEPVAAALTRLGRPFILATGHTDAAALVAENAAATVRKPYNIRQVALALAKAAGRLPPE